MAKKQLKTKHKNELALLSNNVSSFVKDVAKYKGNVIGHLILAKEMLKVGDEVCCFSFRKNIGNNHTAIHLLQSALRIVLGDTVQQKGSQVSEENLRFDFSSNRAITSDEKNEIEEIINDWIDKCLQVSSVEMPKSEAEKLEALAFFGDKYGEKVRVVRIFGQDGMAISTEFCCGIHAKNTGEIGDFVIESEKSIGSGVRRITAYTGDIAKQYKKNICPANNEISRLKEDLKEKDKTWESNCEKFLQSVKIDTVMINSKRNDNMKSGENNLAMLTIAVICGDFSSVFANFIRKKLGNQYDAIFTCGIDDKFVKVTNNYNNDAKNDAIKDNNDIIDNNDYYECVFSGKSAGNFNCAVAMQKVVALLLETAINITSNGDQNKKNYARMQYKMPRNKKEKINWKGIISHIFLD